MSPWDSNSKPVYIGRVSPSNVVQGTNMNQLAFTGLPCLISDRIWSRFVCWLCSADAVKPTIPPTRTSGPSSDAFKYNIYAVRLEVARQTREISVLQSQMQQWQVCSQKELAEFIGAAAFASPIVLLGFSQRTVSPFGLCIPWPRRKSTRVLGKLTPRWA